MYNGVINIYKEEGYTSFDVVAKLRGILKQKKIGHTGTLDPDAIGVLPICLGKATKLCDILTDKIKVYETEFILGYETDTYDTSGKVVNTINKLYDTEKDILKTNLSKYCNDVKDIITSKVDVQNLKELIYSFNGDIKQLPPMYSAIKMHGKKLYEYARANIDVELKERDVHISNIEILDINLPIVKIRVTCSKGTYIRSICYDIGKKLGVYATMSKLCREKSGDFDISNAVKLDEIQGMNDEEIQKLIRPIDEFFSQYDKVVLSKEMDKLANNGNKLFLDVYKQDYLRIYDSNNNFIGIYKFDKGVYKSYKLFI